MILKLIITNLSIVNFDYRKSMNFLGHFYLGFHSDDLLLGNFIADAVKGNKYLLYRNEVKNGILQHRFIDDFTDNHLITKEILKILYPIHGKYSAVIVDLYYDHFLISNWHKFSLTPSKKFIFNCYSILESKKSEMPEKIKMMFNYLSTQNWIEDYRTIEGLDKIFLMMQNRLKYPNKFHLAAQTLADHYLEIEKLSLLFLADINTENNRKISEFLI